MYFLGNNPNLKRSNTSDIPTPKKNDSRSTDSEVLKDEHKTAIKENVNKFLRNSSLHALKYIGAEELSKMERYLFAVAFFLAILMSSYYIIQIYTKWSTTPIIITTSSVSTSITAIPFPAITICNMNQAKKSRVRNIRPATLDYSLVQSLCLVDDDFELEYTGKAGTWNYFRQFILNVSQPCNELLVSCRYGSEVMSCKDIFDTILTDEGLCCTFNTIDPKYMFINYSEDDSLDTLGEQNKLKAVDWTPEMGYEDNVSPPFSPVPGRGTGNHMGLTVVLNASLSEYYCSSTNSVGFKVLLHNPSESPKISNYGFSVSPATESRVVITPEIQNSARNTRNINIKQRHCLFSNEANQSFYRTYTKRNCELECESLNLEEECGCVLYHMPRNSKDSVICGLKDRPCTQRVKMATDSIQNNASSCDSCLPACFSLSYSSSVTSTPLTHNEIILRKNFVKKIPNVTIDTSNLAVVHFFYVQNSFRAKTREELLGFVEFIANSGGILGVFMGFSILSVIELVYFLSLAPYCAMKNNLNELDKKNDNKKVIAANTNRKDRFSNNSYQKPYGSRLHLFPHKSYDSQKIISVKPRNKTGKKDILFPYCE